MKAENDEHKIQVSCEEEDSLTRKKPRIGSLGGLKLRRFFKKPTNVISSILLIVFLLMAFFAPVLAPFDPTQGEIRDRLRAPDRTFSLGTDQQGRDLLSRVIYGSRIALLVGFSTIAIGLTIGGILGVMAGFYGGWLDTLLMRIMDLLLAFPYILLVVVIVSILGPSMRNAILSIGITNIPHFARIVRSVVLSIRHKEYVIAAESLGVSNLRVITHYIIPNSLSPVIVTATLYFGRNVIAESTLSFLGLGVQPPTAAWGNMISIGRDYLMLHPHLVIMPGIALTLFVYALNTFGDGIRDYLDPRIRQDV